MEQCSFVSFPPRMNHALTTVISPAIMGISIALEVTLMQLQNPKHRRILYSTFHTKKVCPIGLENVLRAFLLHSNI
jgi:hypothetical protein